MLKKIFISPVKTITSAAVIIGALSLVSRLLGIFRDRILAAEFGAGDFLDIYYAAFRLPDLVYNLLILGAVSAGLIPILSGLVASRKNQAGWRLLSSVLNSAIIALIVVCLALFLFAPGLIFLIAPGFQGEKAALAASLTRIMLLSPIFLGLSAIFGSILQSFRRFFAYSLAPVFYNLGIIFGALFLVDSCGIQGLAWGVVLGAFLHFLLQFIPALALGFKYHWGIDFLDKNFRQVAKLTIPRTLTLIVNQINLVVVTIVASTLAGGSLAIFNLANNLQGFSIGIFGVSFAVAALPVLSSWSVKGRLNKFVQVFSSTFREILFFVVPISVLLYVLRAQAVRIILGTGQFDWFDTRLTAACLGIFALGLFAQSTLPLAVRGFYALANSKTPFFIGLGALAVNFFSLIIFRWIFSFNNWFSFLVSGILKIADLWPLVDFRILALPAALSLAGVFNLALLLIFLRRLVGRLDGRKIIGSVGKITLSSLGAGIFCYFTLQGINLLVATETFLGIFIQTAVAGLAGLVGYWFLSIIFKMEEMEIFLASLKKKFFRRIQPWILKDTKQEGEGFNG